MTFITKKQSHIFNAFIKETLLGAQIHFVLIIHIYIFNSYLVATNTQAASWKDSLRIHKVISMQDGNLFKQ